MMTAPSPDGRGDAFWRGRGRRGRRWAASEHRDPVTVRTGSGPRPGMSDRTDMTTSPREGSRVPPGRGRPARRQSEIPVEQSNTGSKNPASDVYQEARRKVEGVAGVSV